ncbi:MULTISPECIES: site-specific integrase [unclassified Pseudoclavibacter]|uniref:site-specific integrase n=1 Tax=unclassified Pseudoclavibacter TaxID=2615177 RepID=UPI0017884B42|nr:MULTISPECIES: site-specific integrase [unclassified Pseudoclavibacter]MCD7100583.1 site-specific integrase [Pseudoclavibacter sp. 13-3]
MNRTLHNRLSRVLIRELSVPLLEGIVASILAERGAWNAKMSRIVLSMVCQHLVRMGLIERDFAAATTPIRPAKTEREALSAHDVDVVRRVLIQWESTKRRGVRPNADIRRILDVVLGTSMRPGEVLALRRRDVLIADEQVFVSVNGTMQQNGQRKPTPKRARQMRIICLPVFAADIIMTKLQVQTDDDGYLFQTRQGTPYLLNNLDRAFRKFRDWAVDQGLFDDLESAVDNVLFSTMRKTVATEIASLGDLELAAKLLGHASTETTRRFYIKELPWVDQRTAALLQDAFGYGD